MFMWGTDNVVYNIPKEMVFIITPELRDKIQNWILSVIYSPDKKIFSTLVKEEPRKTFFLHKILLQNPVSELYQDIFKPEDKRVFPDLQYEYCNSIVSDIFLICVCVFWTRMACLKYEVVRIVTRVSQPGFQPWKMANPPLDSGCPTLIFKPGDNEASFQCQETNDTNTTDNDQSTENRGTN